MFRRLITRLERALAYFPELTLKGTPEHVGLRYEDLWLKTEDGNSVHAWWIPGPAELPASSGPHRPTWVYFHGNGGNISARLDGYRAIHMRTGANVLAVDYRGFGLSPGKPTELGTYADGRAAVTEAIRLRTEQQGIAGPLVLFGVSMGAAVASRLACETGPDALVLESPPSSFPDLAPLHYPWTRLLPISKIMAFRYETRTHVTQLDVPTLVIHGDEDEIVPMYSAQRVFDSAKDPKRLHIVEGGTHNRPDLVDEDRYYDVVHGFMQEFAVPRAESRSGDFAAD